MHVRPSPLLTFWKSAWIVESVTVLKSTMKEAADGVVSVVVQLGPRAPMKDVFPKRTLFSTVKLNADDIAMP